MFLEADFCCRALVIGHDHDTDSFKGIEVDKLTSSGSCILLEAFLWKKKKLT